MPRPFDRPLEPTETRAIIQAQTETGGNPSSDTVVARVAKFYGHAIDGLNPYSRRSGMPGGETYTGHTIEELGQCSCGNQRDCPYVSQLIG